MTQGIPDNPRGRLLMQANKCVNHDRNSTYGDPNQDFARTAKFWQTYLDGIIEARGEFKLLPHDVALMIDLLKTSRLVWSPTHDDNWVDKAGYTACGFDCAQSTYGSSEFPLPEVPISYRPVEESPVANHIPGTGSSENMFLNAAIGYPRGEISD